MSHNLRTLNKVRKSYIASTGKAKSIFVVLFGIIVAFLGMLEPLIFTEIIKKIELFLTDGVLDINGVIWISLFWITYTFIVIALMYIYDYFFLAKTIIKNYQDESLNYAQKSIMMTMGCYLGKQIGGLYKILDRGTENQLFLIYGILRGILRSSFQIIFISIVLFIIDWRMAIATLALVPVVLGIGLLIFLKISPTQKRLDEIYVHGFGIIGNGLSNFGLTKILNIEGVLYRRMKNIFDDSFQKQLDISKGWSLAHGYVVAVVMISRIIVILLGIYLINKGDLDFATLFLFFSYIGWIYFPLDFLFNQLRQLQKSITAIEIMHDEFDYLDFEEYKGKNIKAVQGNISFRDVGFGYQEGMTIINNMDLDIQKGQKIALVGNTGAGKSTVVNLLLRFWDITEGKITLDGIDIRDIKKSSLRSHIGVVSQDNSLFNLSIEENLKFANPKATKKQIEEALKNAEAQFVFDLKDGIKTVIGERGLKLSGGEKQRISIARLFLKNPEILILDEATSALDNTTEKKIEKALYKLMKGKTSIIIAHRLSTIQHADKILVLEKGKIVESGTYDELMKQRKKFYNLANPDRLVLA